MQFMKLLMKLEDLTSKPVCKLCFNNFYPNTFNSFFNKTHLLCPKCFKKLKFKMEKIKFLGTNLYSLAPYNEEIRALIIQYKENYDYELKDLFLLYYLPFLKIRFHKYKIVLVPSNLKKIQDRGFNHLLEIFKPLNLEILDVLEKENEQEQKKSNRETRYKIAFKFKDLHLIKNQRILLVDDVITTGSSLKNAYKILLKGQAKKIDILVISHDNPLDYYSKIVL